MKILNIIGARPQIIKASAISRAIATYFPDKIEDIVVHTGQHYDYNMSQVFFEELNIPKPCFNLGVGSASHGKQTADMIVGLENLMVDLKPNCLLVYGDTNSTLSAAIAGSKLHVPIVHIEAGLRSFNKSMPEEINRIMCDHSSTLLFAPTDTAVQNLQHEGFVLEDQPPYSIDKPGVFHCGDIMYDNSLHFAKVAELKNNFLGKNNLTKNHYVLVTVHRDNNTDIPSRLNAIFETIFNLSFDNHLDFIVPLHPRTAKLLKTNLKPQLYSALTENKRIKIIPPASYLEIIELEKNALLVMTDSGGVQKEAFFFKKPCIILRPETEWKELVACGAALIADASEEKINQAFNHFMNHNHLEYPPFFGDGKAAEFICKTMLNCFME